MPHREDCDAVVVGGGAAGVAAARELLACGCEHVVILEARQRVGGRTYTSDELGCGVQLDHGAQWIHGHSSKNWMSKLADCSGLSTCRQADGVSLNVHSNGTKPSSKDERVAHRALQDLKLAVRRGLANHPGKDCTWEEAVMAASGARAHHREPEAVDPVTSYTEVQLATMPGRPQYLWDLGAKLTAEQRSLRNLHLYFAYENYEGARLDSWSARHGHETTCLDGPNADVLEGYGNLISQLATGLDIRSSRRVVAVDYPVAEGQKTSDRNAEPALVVCTAMATDDGTEEVYIAPKCVITLPLGVLRSGAVLFRPPMPSHKAQPLHRLGVALMDKVEILWAKRWWPTNVGSLTISSLESNPVYHPWPWFLEPRAARRHPLGMGVLVCFVTGRFAEEVESLDDQKVVDGCIEALRKAFPKKSVPDPIEAHTTRWGRDPYALGSWTYYAKDSGPADASALAESIGSNGCVAFAGEHTCDGSQHGLDMGTVHGAWLSGVLAARRISGAVACDIEAGLGCPGFRDIQMGSSSEGSSSD